MMIASLTLLLLGADPEWTELSKKDGFLVERRAVTNSSYYEYRVTTDTDVTVGPLCDCAFEWGSVSKDHEQLKDRRLLEDNGELRVTYDQIATPPPVATRDVAFTVKRDRRPDGTCRVDFFSTNEKAPPLPPGWVRVNKLKGHWYFEPRASGTRVTYYLFNDPGGSLPPALVHGSQRKAALDTVKKGIRLSREGLAGARRP